MKRGHEVNQRITKLLNPEKQKGDEDIFSFNYIKAFNKCNYRI